MAILHPVILSGGSGTRLWPLSRAMYPKQFIADFGMNGSGLLAETLSRLSPEDGFAAPLIVCNNDHRFLASEAAGQAGVAPSAIILEPVARNTAAAIAVAAFMAKSESPSAIVVVMPSDHIVRDKAGFAERVRRACDVAATGRLVLFGVPPTEPHAGYGYIRAGAALDGFADARAVDAFVEKPDAATARSYLAHGGYFWNSGIFVLDAATFLAELDCYAPGVLAAAREALAAAQEDLGFLRLDHEAFAKSPDISVDYAVMEKTRTAAMLPLDVGWRDVGSWSSVWQMAPHDANLNSVRGDAVLEDTSGCHVHSEGALVATIGVKDLVIVDTPDAVLVADKARAQDVSKIVARLRKMKRREHEHHLRSYRPWGYYETLNAGPRFQVKRLYVKPGAELSYQMHQHRSEHWIVVHGTALVTIEGIEKLVYENESVYIVPTQWHRLANRGKVPLELIEVQIGTYLGEDDIIRCEDAYRRASEETK